VRFALLVELDGVEHGAAGLASHQLVHLLRAQVLERTQVVEGEHQAFQAERLGAVAIGEPLAVLHKRERCEAMTVVMGPPARPLTTEQMDTANSSGSTAAR
jgi:hypothetical protein